DHFFVAQFVEVSIRVEDVGNTSTHTGSKILPGLAEYDYATAGHVFTGMVTHTLHDGMHARVPDTETFTGLAPDIGFAAGGAIEGNVADNDVFFRHKRCARIRINNKLSAGEALAKVVVGLAHEPEGYPGRDERAKALSCRTGKLHLDRVFRKSLRLILLGNLVRQHRSRSPIDVSDRKLHLHRLRAFQSSLRPLDQFAIEYFFQFEILFDLLVHADMIAERFAIQDRREVELFELPVIQWMAYPEYIRAADHLIDFSETEFGHDLTQVVRQEAEEVHHVIRISREELAERFVLCGNTDRTRIEVTFTHHNTAFDDERCRGNAPLFGTQQGCYGDVATRANLTVCLQYHTASEIVLHQCLMRFGKPELPGQSGVTNGPDRRCSRSAICTGNEDCIGLRLSHPCGNCTHTGLAHQLHVDARPGVGVL